MFEWMLMPEAWVALATLLALKIVLGIDNIISVMVIAIIGAAIVMLFAASPIGVFVDAHPTIKMLALSYLILIGFTLVAEGFDVHVPKGYIYFAMAFSVAVELLNIRVNRRRTVEPVRPVKQIENE